MSANHSKTKKKSSIGFVEEVRRSRPLYLLMLPSIIIFALFTYYPMYGIVIAFKNFTPAEGIMGSSWAGLKYFKQYFNSYQFGLTIKNTIIISLYTIAVTFPLPVIMGLLVNQMKAQKFKKFFQVSTYLPHFISTVVMAGMLILFLSPSTGIIAKLVGLLGFKLPNLMGSAKAFPHIYVWSEAWQHVGWDSILYIATLSSVDPTLYEAATMDGANKWHKMIHIDVPALLPTATIMFIMRMGSVMSIGFEKAYALQTDMNLPASEILSTYVYRIGLLNGDYGYSTAVGLFNSVVNVILLIFVNWVVKKLNDGEGL